MGWLDKITGRNKPEYKKALELEKERIRTEGEAVSGQMAEHFKQRREAQNAEHKRITDAQDADISSKLREMGIDPNQLKKPDKQE